REPVPLALAPRAFAMDDPVALLLGELGPRHVDANPALLREPQHVVLALAVALALKRPDRAFAQGLRRVRNREPIVDADRPPEAAARLARSDRRVERERVGDRIRVGHVAVRAMERRREPQHGARRIEQPNRYAPRADLQRRLEILDEPRPVVVA